MPGKTMSPTALAAVLLAGTIGVAFLPSIGRAETPEQAVAYAFLGLAADATLDRGAMHLEWHEASASPAMFVGHGEGGGRSYDVTFTVTARSDCDYEIELAGPPGMVRGGKTLYARIALRDISGIVGGAFQVAIEGDGFCQTGATNPNCTLVHKTDVYGALDPTKHARLVEQLQMVCVRP
jgi:hypothetical protein